MPEESKTSVELTPCDLAEVIERGLSRIIEDLTNAIDRTPHIITSRPLIESSLKLAMGIYDVALRLRSALCK